MEREVGGGIGMGNTCKSMADSFQCMTKPTTIKKKIKKKKKKESLTLFGDMLARDLRNLILDERLLFQSTGNMLLARLTHDKCLQNTIRTLNYLAHCGYKVFQKKAQVHKH